MSTETTSLERTNLEAHVDLCAERYKGLESRLDRVEKEIKDVRKDIQEMREENLKMHQNSNKILLGAAATVVAGVLSYC